jgi:hypothetical protein
MNNPFLTDKKGERQNTLGSLEELQWVIQA